ncbi:hypothetical protein V6N12_030293 [Hibiscus sabdariffa]|uniref:RNase H type-1 domain-containing protein n=1 Tax=Hibiscus sabdariffa TaxID=183260 RepID=A0ABR2C0H0_9ROSI
MEVVDILRGIFIVLLKKSLVDDLRELLFKDWNVVFRHISREQNEVADALVALGCEGPIGVTLFEHLLNSINRLLANDSCVVTTAHDGG